MNESNPLREVALAVVCGVATFFGIKLAQRLDDPYSEPRLTVTTWLNDRRGGDPA